jgi:hypothetical protein
MVPSRRLAIASGAPTNAIDMVRDLDRTGTFDVRYLDRILKCEVYSLRTSHILGCARWATVRSSAFLGTFLTIYQSMYFHFLSTPSMSSQYLFVAWFCSKHYNRLLSFQSVVKVPRRVLDLFVSKYSYALGGFLGALSLFVEEKRRRELAMYVLPKGLESAWLTARGKGWSFIPGILERCL